MKRKKLKFCLSKKEFFLKNTTLLVIFFLFFSPLQANSLPIKSYEDWYLTQEALAGKIWDSSGKSRVERLLTKQLGSLYFDSNSLYFAQRDLSVVVEYAYRKLDLKKLDEIVSLLLPTRFYLECLPVKGNDGQSFLAECWITKTSETILIEEVFPGANSISVQNASFFPDSGIVMIDGEIIFYRHRDKSRNILSGLEIKEYHSAGSTVFLLNENILNSSQFIYLLARVLNIISSLPSSKRTANMNAFLVSFTPLVCNHLYRWQYRQSAQWWVNSFIPACSHYQRLKILYTGSYGFIRLSPLKKRVTDVDLWIIASTAEFLGSALNDSYVRRCLERKAPGSKRSYHEQMKKYLKLGIKLVKRRTEVNVPGFRFIFDRGTRKDHPDHLYACFFEEATRAVINLDGSITFLPRILGKAERDLYKDSNATFDIGHGMRLPLVFLSLYRSKSLVKENFPDNQVIKALGAQFYEKVYNRNSSSPLFKVYLNGVNGWYRVDYAGRVGYGIGPWGLSHTVFYGYYTLLIPFEPRLKEITKSLANLMMNEKKKDFVLSYYSRICNKEGKIYPLFYSQLIFGSTPNLSPPKIDN